MVAHIFLGKKYILTCRIEKYRRRRLPAPDSLREPSWPSSADSGIGAKVKRYMRGSCEKGSMGLKADSVPPSSW